MLSFLCSALFFLSGSDAQIRWSPPGSIFVNVVNRDLSPLPGAAISLHRAGSPDAEPFRSATANAGGHVEFRQLPADSYTVRVRHPGYLDLNVGPMPVEPSEAPKVRVPQILAVMNPIMQF